MQDVNILHDNCLDKRRILHLFTTRFIELYYTQQDSIPKWLTDICNKMMLKENFTIGLPALLLISGKTHNYICFIFKKYFNQSPTQYVNKLRLNYAENLLINSDIAIIEISLEAGFENLSHFYHTFKKSFNTTPYKYRKANQKRMFP